MTARSPDMPGLPPHWRRTFKRRPRLGYQRSDGVVILQDTTNWAIHERLGTLPAGRRKTLADAIAWADEHITENA